MGTFLGHAIPGVFFALFSLWWATQLPRRRLLCDQKKITYFNTATFPVPFDKWSKYPVEGVAKMVAAVLGMSCELFASLGYGNMKLESMGDIQHFTMYSFFMISGVVDCFVYRGSKIFPQGTDYFALILAFVAEWVIFYHHLSGRTPLDIQVHTFLLYVISACVLTLLYEHHWPNSEIVTLLRSYVTFIQGTWFFQIGFILYPPFRSLHHWDGDDPDQRMLVTMIFAWHCLADIIIILGIYLIVRSCYTKHCRLFEFRVEHQLVAHGWTLSKLRSQKQKKHKGHVYLQVQQDEQYSIVSDNDEVVETEIT